MHPRSMNCRDHLPDLPLDRHCTAMAGHDGPHNDGAVTWEGSESGAIREAVERVAQQLAADIPRAARVAVLGAVDTAVTEQAPPTRQQKRAAARKGSTLQVVR